MNFHTWYQDLQQKAHRWPMPLRTLIGLGLIVLGILGALLPVLGLWMVPLGLMVLALDFPFAAKLNRVLIARSQEASRLLKRRFWR